MTVNWLREELQIIGSMVRENRRVLTVICSAVLVLTLADYHEPGERWSTALIFYALLPVLTVVLVLRENPLDYGLRPGNWRVWGVHVVLACLIALPILFAVSRLDTLHAYYSVSDFELWEYFVPTVVYLISWEFLFRGFLLFGLKEKFKETSILIQMIPFVLLHLGKPEIETLSTIPMGIYLGYVAYRGNSCWPAVIIHIFINISFRTIVNWL
jgi:membrane protease YdiL (CAAX protease family)